MTPPPGEPPSGELPDQLSVRPLTPDDDTSSFSCGNDVLDLWLHQHAWSSQRRRTAATQVLTDAAGGTAHAPVLGYYSLASTSIATDGLPRRLGRGQLAILPAILLARLAVDQQLHGQGIGGALLSHAIRTADRAGRVVAARLLVVDAIDDRAASFYRHYGFTPLTRSHSRERLAAVISHLL
ncbi:MAG: N-acetyltransferase [Actinomyces sp.]|nr:MAG: N-acetyltransferase [Actinomyces sp.]